MQEREQVISYLFQAVDLKNRVIEDLQKKVAELEKYKAEHPESNPESGQPV